jgi:hypothetical protein
MVFSGAVAEGGEGGEEVEVAGDEGGAVRGVGGVPPAAVAAMK